MFAPAPSASAGCARNSKNNGQGCPFPSSLFTSFSLGQLLDALQHIFIFEMEYLRAHNLPAAQIRRRHDDLPKAQIRLFAPSFFQHLQQAGNVSGRSKPARAGRMKTSHFEERIALSAVETAQRRDESTQRELATFHHDFGGAWLVPPADCARAGHQPGDGGQVSAAGAFKIGHFDRRLAGSPGRRTSHFDPRHHGGAAEPLSAVADGD